MTDLPAPPRGRGRPRRIIPPPHPTMTPAAFVAWRKRMGLNISDAARELGVSRKWIMKFGNGESVVPRHIALACVALEKEIGQAK